MPANGKTSESRQAIGRYALKANEAFLVADGLGDITGDGDGLFRDDTRILSCFRLRLGTAAPSLLSSGVSRDNVFFRANLTNRPLPELGGRVTPEGVIHIERSRFLWESRLHECLTLTNYGDNPVPAPLRFQFAADFADIFEVRGHRRAHRGRMLEPHVGDDAVTLGYEGLDGVARACVVAFSLRPDRLDRDAADFTLTLEPHGQLRLYVEIGPDRPGTPGSQRFRSAAARARIAMRRKRRRGATLQSPARPFRWWLDKSRADLALLTTEYPTGPYPFAGIPWFSTPFGRDGIITALQTLWLDPSLSRGVLRYLAQHQAHEVSTFQDAAPGKIMHETRQGEMSVLREMPFARYYGSVDATPLFVMLAGAYAQRTGDLGLIAELWPALVLAMDWIDGATDANPDGFLDYARESAIGLVNQGWKDSADSIFHADGTMAKPPIALVEVQGYVFAARRAMSWLAERRGERALGQHWRNRARELRTAVEQRFWMPERGFYALARDGTGQPCRVRASNAGQLLYSRLPSASRAALMIEHLSSAAFDDGWGVRTLARDEVRFNPMSYHNGSIWPHDTALCAAGMASYGYREAAARLLSELFAAALDFGTRLPELYCGFAHRTGEPPVGYPVACLPQAWSAGAVFMMLQACLGVSIDGLGGIVYIDRPELPSEVDRLIVRGLEVGDTSVDIAFDRVGDRVAAAPIGRPPRRVKILVRA